MMKVLIITGHYMPDGFSGQNKFVKVLSEHLKEKGYVVSILSYAKSYAGMDKKIGNIFYREYIYSGVGVFSIKQDGPLDAYSLRAELYENSYKTILKKFSPDIVHFTPFNYMCGIIPIVKKLKIPYIMTCVDGYLYCAKKFMLLPNNDYCTGSQSGNMCTYKCSELQIDFKKRYEDASYIIKNAFAVVTPSNFLAERYCKEFDTENISVMKHGIEQPRFKNCKEYNKNDSITFGYTGNLGLLKGIHILLSAFNAVSDTSNMKLKIYGSGCSEDFFKIINSSAEFCNSYDFDQLDEVYSNIDVLICPSFYYETYSYTVMEALQRGIPVIATNTGAMAENIKNFYNGIKFERGNYLELSNIMFMISKNPDIINFLKKNTDIADITIEKEIDYYTRLYEDAIVNKPYISMPQEKCLDVWSLIIQKLIKDGKIRLDINIFKEFTEAFSKKEMADEIDIKALYAKLLYFDSKNQGKEVKYTIWGASASGIMTKKLIDDALPEYKMVCWFDAYKTGIVADIEIKTIDEVDTKQFDVLFICTDAGREQAENKMKEIGFKFLENYFYGYKI